MHHGTDVGRIEALIRQVIQQKEDKSDSIKADEGTRQQNVEDIPREIHTASPCDLNSARIEHQAVEALTRNSNHVHLNETSSNIVISGVARQRCPSLCKCQCHKTSRMQTPSFLQSVVGHLCVQYNSMPFFDRRPCDSWRCSSNSRVMIRLQYRFPSWMAARAVCALVSSHGLNDAGAYLHLKVPRVNNLPGLQWAVRQGNIPWLQRRISGREILPTDVMSNGQSIVMVRYY